MAVYIIPMFLNRIVVSLYRADSISDIVKDYIPI